jgi:glutamyl-tRNA reductase
VSGHRPAAIERLAAVAVHAREVPEAERESLAGRLRMIPPGNLVLLETCHRVEAYLADMTDPEGFARDIGLVSGGRLLIGEAAVRHLVTVAVGRDSVVVGEDQILHQVREAIDGARRAAQSETLEPGSSPAGVGSADAGRLDSGLERLFDRALQAGRRARSWRQGSDRSLADVAVGRIEELTGPLAGRQLLVVGAGRMGGLAARAGARAGTSVTIANRTPEAAVALATSTGGRAGPFDPGPAIAGFAGVVVALAGPWLISPATMTALAGCPTVVVDLSVPQAVAPAAALALGPRLVSADGLAQSLATVSSEASPAERRRLDRVDRLIDETTHEHLDWLARRPRRATAEALIEQADHERQAELALLWRDLPDLEPETRAAIDGMTRHLARRLLREPLERLGRDSDGRDERAVRELFAL